MKNEETNNLRRELSRRTTRKLRVRLVLAENPRDFAPHFFLRPVRVLRTEPRRFHFARRPAKLFRQRQAAFGRHPAVNRELLRAGLFIRQHEKIMRQKNGSRKCRANDGEYMKPFLAEARGKQKQEAVENREIHQPRERFKNRRAEILFSCSS
jgi:hypothetical protein